jgi:putative radical SAM enzyme (TIGR03279 family)
LKNKYEVSKNLLNVNNNEYKHKIVNIVKGSIADELKIKPGYKLISINSNSIIDILDYKFLICDEYIELEIENLNNEILKFDIEKDDYEELGLIFENELIDKPKNCLNKCIFCFMEQLPPNVRKTLIFKDDDYRLSFLSGNYITLTNIKDSDIDRIIKYRVSPINISIHATDEEIRCMMLNNKNAYKVLKYIDRLNENNIKMNFQIVLCKNINDKDVLNKTLLDLTKYVDNTLSISIVPVGISKYRDNLFKLESFTKEDCIQVINSVSKLQKEFKKLYKTNLVYLSDEFYLKSNIKIPKFSHYEDFNQLENGVGMIAVFEKEFKKEILKFKKNINKVNFKDINKKICILTGVITYEYIKQKADELNKLLNKEIIYVDKVENNYFGKDITVTGLITGQDVIEKIRNNKDKIIISDVCLKEDEDIFLDDVTLDDVKKVNKNIYVCDNSAYGMLYAIFELLKG